MNTQKFLMSGIAGGIVSFFAGWLFYGILLADFFAKNAGSATGVMRGDADMVEAPQLHAATSTGKLTELAM